MDARPLCPCCSAGPATRRFRILSAQLPPSVQAAAVDPWTRWRAVESRIAAGEVILMDGATGTEVERRVLARGDPSAVTATGWSCAQALLHPDVCQAVHQDYFEAGAELVIANTYASNRMILQVAGFGEQVAEVHERACGAAMAARSASAGDGALVVGSMSGHPPMIVEGGGSMGHLTDGASAPTEDTAPRAPSQVVRLPFTTAAVSGLTRDAGPGRAACKKRTPIPSRTKRRR